MENDAEVTLDVVEETTNDTVEVAEAIETEADALAKAQAEAAKYRRLFEKTQKAKEETKPATPTVDPIEAALRVNGMSKELLEQLKKVAAVTNLDLLDAQHDPLFVALKEKVEKEQKREDASMPAARGAGAVKAKKDFSSSGLTREEHQAMVKSLL